METIEILELDEKLILSELIKHGHSIDSVLKRLINVNSNYPLCFFNSVAKKECNIYGIIIYWQNNKLQGYGIIIDKTKSIIRQVYNFTKTIVELIQASNKKEKYIFKEEYQMNLFYQFINGLITTKFFRLADDGKEIIFKN